MHPVSSLSLFTGSGLVKTRNMLVASGAAGAVCWPQQTVETTSNAYRYVKEPVAEWITQHGLYSLHIFLTKRLYQFILCAMQAMEVQCIFYSLT